MAYLQAGFVARASSCARQAFRTVVFPSAVAAVCFQASRVCLNAGVAADCAGPGILFMQSRHLVMYSSHSGMPIMSLLVVFGADPWLAVSVLPQAIRIPLAESRTKRVFRFMWIPWAQVSRSAALCLWWNPLICNSTIFGARLFARSCSAIAG